MTSCYYNLRKSFQPDVYTSNSNILPACDYRIRRLGGYSFVKPLLYVEKSCETGLFMPMKQHILEIIDKDKLQGKLLTASVYVRDFNEGDFMAINENTLYQSGALMNIPLLITYLHLDENNEGYLNKELLLAHSYPNKENRVNITEPGKKYSLNKLLELMIVKHDNNATNLLYEFVDKKAFQKTFTDVGLTMSGNISQASSLTADEVSLFMRALYNATYLTSNNSEYATKLLSEGYKRNNKLYLPASVGMASSYSSTTDSDVTELHESAIIYLNNYPYTITIMTKGSDEKQLSDVINQISSAVYKEIVAKKIS